MDNSVEFGFKRTAISLGIDPYTLLKKQAAQQIVDNSLEEQKLYSKAGAMIFEKAGYAGSIQHRILQKCASYDTVLSKQAYAMFVQPVKDVLCANPANMNKQASAAITGALGKSIGSLAGLLSQSPSLLLALAVGAGSLGGGSIYAMQRAMDQEDAETAAKFEQAKIYREQANQIAEQMANKANETTTKKDNFIF